MKDKEGLAKTKSNIFYPSPCVLMYSIRITIENHPSGFPNVFKVLHHPVSAIVFIISGD